MSTPVRFLRLALPVLLLASLPASAQDKPPVPPVRPVTDTIFGKTVTDPYRYFEDLKDPEVAAWMKAQADYAKKTLDRIPGRDALLKEVQQYGDAAAARIFGVQVVGDKIYYEKRLANENLPKLYVRDGFNGKERLLLDPDAVKTPGVSHYALDFYVPSPDNKHLAYGVSPSGSEESVIHVLDVATGKPTSDVIDRAHYSSVSWLPDGRMLYSRLQKLPPDAPVTDKFQNQRTFVHTLGNNPDEDPVVFGAGVAPDIKVTPVEGTSVVHTPGSPYLLALANNGVQREFRAWVVPITALAGAKTPWTPVFDTSDDVTDVSVHGEDIYLTTHKGAPRFKVLKTSLAKPDLAAAEVVVPAGESVINGTVAAGDALYVRKMNGGNSELYRLAYAPGTTPTQVALPFLGDIDNLAADPRKPGVAFFLGGWTRFGQYYAYDPKAGSLRDTKLAPQGKYDRPDDLVATPVKAKAPDGTLIPMSIVHRKGLKLDGTNPTIVYGYGAYGISQTPFYRPSWLPWFKRGGVLAVAHVRGGGEYGQEWYKAGYQSTKPNTWRDAIACTEWLVANRYTSTRQVSIMGGSAGGIFVGRAITERPDLFGAAVDQVPASDMLRAEFSANGVPNIPEFGTVKTEEGFNALYAMSPYHWVKDGVTYPAVLLTTGINDPRVDAWEAGKMAARLQAASTGGKPILLRIDYDAGHGLGSTKKQAYEERADTFAFLFWQAGVKQFQP
jgi:prolyl oligopeptidase